MTILFKIPRVGPRVPWAQGPALIRDPWPKATGPFPGPYRTVRGVWGDPSPQAGPPGPWGEKYLPRQNGTYRGWNGAYRGENGAYRGRNGTYHDEPFIFVFVYTCVATTAICWQGEVGHFLQPKVGWRPYGCDIHFLKPTLGQPIVCSQ